MCAKIIELRGVKSSKNKEFFENNYLYQAVMERIDGRQVFMKNAYLFEKELSNEEINLFSKKIDKKDLRDIYLEILIESKHLLKQIPILVTKSNYFGEREIVTNVGIPNADIYSKNYYLFQKIFPNICLNGVQSIDTIHFLTIGEGEVVTMSEVVEYVAFLTYKDNYLMWLNILFQYMGCLSGHGIELYQNLDGNEKLLMALNKNEFVRRLER